MNKDKLKKVISILLILIMIGCGYIIFDETRKTVQVSQETQNFKELIESHHDINVQEEPAEFSKSAWKELKEKNEDFVGYLFIGDVIEQPIVQTDNNSYYLHRTFAREWLTNNGNPFIDCWADEDSTNITIYGHNSSWKQDIIFSHLNDVILDQDYYEKNSKIRFYLEDEKREYEICYAYYINEKQFQTYDFSEDNFDDIKEFSEFIQYARDHSEIKNIYGDIYWGDNFLTLQTCKRYNQDIKVVVVAREVGRSDYN